MNERVILGTASRLYKAVEKEFSLPAREEGTLPACLRGLDIYLRLGKSGASLNHHCKVREAISPCFPLVLKLFTFSVDMAEGYHSKLLV